MARASSEPLVNAAIQSDSLCVWEDGTVDSDHRLRDANV